MCFVIEMKILSLFSIEQRTIEKQKDHNNVGEKTQKYLRQT